MTKQDNIQSIITKINRYTKAEDVPLLKEACYTYRWNHDRIMDLCQTNAELDRAVKRLLYKKEAAIEKGMLAGKYSATGSVFSLKQLGWRDGKTGTEAAGERGVSRLEEIARELVKGN